MADLNTNPNRTTQALTVEELVAEVVTVLRDTSHSERVSKALEGIKNLGREDITPDQQQALQAARATYRQINLTSSDHATALIRNIAPTASELAIDKSRREKKPDFGRD